MTEPTSADPDALGRFVDTSGRVRGGLSERTASLEGLVRWIEAGCVDAGVPGMAALVERLTALAVQWEVSETGVAAVRRALMGADGGLGPVAGPVPVVVDIGSLVDEGRDEVADGLAVDLMRAGMTDPLAAVIAAETVRLVGADPSSTVHEALRRATATAAGVSEEELDRRRRAFGLGRAAVAAVVLEHWDEAERASNGYGHGVTLAGLRWVADDERAPAELRDAAYRLASDPGLFNDIDAATRSTGVTPTGYDWSKADGLVGRSDLEGFGVQDGRIRAVLPWRLLLDTATDGFRLDGADGVIRGWDLERFVQDRRIPVVVRQAARELNVGRSRASGMPETFVVFDPLAGQPLSLDTAALAGLSGDDAVAALFWAAATGRVPADGPALDPIPDRAWIDEHGTWRDGQTNRPLAGAFPPRLGQHGG